MEVIGPALTGIIKALAFTIELIGKLIIFVADAIKNFTKEPGVHEDIRPLAEKTRALIRGEMGGAEGGLAAGFGKGIREGMPPKEPVKDIGVHADLEELARRTRDLMMGVGRYTGGLAAGLGKGFVPSNTAGLAGRVAGRAILRAGKRPMAITMRKEMEPQFMALEQARQQFQIGALGAGENTIQGRMLEMQREAYARMLKELEDINKNTEEKPDVESD
jgi:hypothetical protein